MKRMDLCNRKILITGASSGIGRATAILASKSGADVVICGRNEQVLEETQNEMDCPQKHIRIVFDVREFDKYNEVFQTAVSDGTKLDGLVHCAGVAPSIPLRMMKQSVINEVMNINFTSFMCMAGMYSKKKFSNGGSIVAISSANSHYPQKCMSVYAASKYALEAAVKTISLELVPQGIRANCVIPGAIRTPMMDGISGDTIDKIEEKQLMGVGKPEDVANMIIFLLSDASSFITGRSMFVDGGLLGQ